MSGQSGRCDFTREGAGDGQPDLLEGAFRPTTEGIGFIAAPHRAVADAFVAWQAPIQAGRTQPVRLRTAPIEGSLRSALQALAPLTSVEPRRFLFAPTTCEWTVYFENRWPAPDAYAVPTRLGELLGVPVVRFVCAHQGPRTKFGAYVLERFGPGPRRTVSLVNDGGRWGFDEIGSPLPFEDAERYRARRPTDRFDAALLVRYAGILGIRALEHDFYFPAGTAGVLVEKLGPDAPGLCEHDWSSTDPR
ncbi:MAG: hypothetical protein QM704_26725 [Anaeromyxobacteraceae bacterium]